MDHKYLEFEKIIETFNNANLKLLTLEKDYTGSESTKFSYRCSCNNIVNNVSYYSFVNCKYKKCNICVKKNIKNTISNIDNYKENNLKKSIKTNLIKRGVEFPMQSDNVKDKLKYNLVNKYNVINVFQMDSTKDKIKLTNINNLGCEYPMQNIKIQEKSKLTSRIKYGVDYPIQNTKVFGNNKRNRFKKKDYKLPSGNIIKIQGYENLALDILLKTYNEDEIITDTEKIPIINYIFKNKQKKYYPDIYIPKDNIIIEVKSTYTYKIKLEQNLAKKKYVLENKYLFEFWIFNNKGELIKS